MERRLFPRVPLDIPVFIRIRLKTGEEQKALLVDVSCGGMQVALPAHGEGGSALLGKAVDLLDLPAAFGSAPAGKGGRVTWVSPQRCGIRFDEPVSLAEGDAMALFAPDPYGS